MTFVSTIDTVNGRINADIATLQSLLGQTEGETLQSINLSLFPAPLFDDTTQIWTLIQNTADANGVYEGQYTLTAANSCAQLTIVSINAHTNPASGAPAAFVACDASSYTDQASVNALNNKSVKKIKIRSGSPFQIKVKVLAEWCTTWDFTINNGGWSYTYGNYVAGIGWRTGLYSAGSTRIRVLNLFQSFASTQITAMSMQFTYAAGTQNATGDRVAALAINGFASGTYLATQSVISTPSSPFGGTINPTAATRADMQLLTGNVGNSTDPGGEATLTRLTMRGLGLNPFGSYNCT